MPSPGNAGVNRQACEPPNCWMTWPHDQHFHSPIGGLTLNCPGIAKKPEGTRISHAEVLRILGKIRARWGPSGRLDESVFRDLENQLIPLVPGEPVQFQELGKQRWFNGTYESPVDNPGDPNRSGDAIVLSTSGRRVSVFLSSVRKRPS